MGNKGDSYYMEKALSEIEIIQEYTTGLSFEEFLSNRQTVDATVFRLQQMAEHIKSFSPEFRNAHPEIPWNEIVGFRNRIVHEYGKTDYTTVYEIIAKEILQLRDLFEASLPQRRDPS